MDFSNDLTQVIATRLAAVDNLANPSTDIQDIHTQLNEVKPGTAEHMALTHDQKDMKRLAKRILKAVKELIEDATRKEAELRGRELEEEMRKLDAMGIFAASKSLEIDGEDEAPKANAKKRSASNVSAIAGASPADEDIEMADADEQTDDAVIHLNVAGKDDTISVPNNKKNTPASQAASCASSSHGHSHHTRHSSNANGVQVPTEPLSPPISTEGSSHPQSTTAANPDPTDVFANGGVPWYLEPFDPEGTTIHDERWTGREVLDRMSEELSDMDEDTLTELAVNGVGETPKGKGTDGGEGVGESAGSKVPKKPKRKGRRQQWSKPRVR